MWIRSSDLSENTTLRILLQLLLRTHGFVWTHRYDKVECDSILFVRIVGNQISVFHTFDSEIYKTIATWTRIKVTSDLDLKPVEVHVSHWPLDIIHRQIL